MMDKDRQDFGDSIKNKSLNFNNNVKMKECSKCQRILPATLEFFHKKLDCIYGLNSLCKECKRKYNKTRNKKYLYSISINEFNNRIKSQNNRCAICGITFKEDFNQSYVLVPRIDHNHKTGKKRGLLCDRCNLLLGKAKDNIFILIRAIKYLKEFRKEN